MIIIESYFVKSLSLIFKWNVAVFTISLIFSFILVAVYYKFHKSKHVSQYKKDLEDAKILYNKAIENLALKYENDLKHQENLHLVKINNLNEEISKLNNQLIHMTIALNNSNMEAMINEKLGGKK